MELIDKNAFLDKFSENYNKGLVCDNVSIEICDSFETCVECIVNTIPLIDAVPVVRCKDCKYSLPNDGKLNDGARYCSRIYGGEKKEHPAVWDVDFCSGGKRKCVQE